MIANRDDENLRKVLQTCLIFGGEERYRYVWQRIVNCHVYVSYLSNRSLSKHTKVDDSGFCQLIYMKIAKTQMFAVTHPAITHTWFNLT